MKSPLSRRVTKLEAMRPTRNLADQMLPVDALHPNIVEMLSSVGGDVSLLDLSQLNRLEADLRRLTV
jgi:hypothetical protein